MTRVAALVSALAATLLSASAAVAEPPAEPVFLPPWVTDSAELAAARAAFAAPVAAREVGPFVLFTDVGDERALRAAEEMAASLPALWRDRYGLEVATAGVGVVVVYDRREDYETLRPAAADDLAGHAAGGLAALHRGRQSRETWLRLLAHEMAHLLADDVFFDRDLPPWLAEGLAEDTSLAGLAGNALVDGPLDRRSVHRGGRVELRGALASVTALRRALTSGELDLGAALALDAEAFRTLPERALVYALYGLLVRHLLEDEALAAPFRGFLAAGAAGGPLHATALYAALGRSSAELGAGLAGWLGGLERRLGLAGLPQSPRRP